MPTKWTQHSPNWPVIKRHHPVIKLCPFYDDTVCVCVIKTTSDQLQIESGKWFLFVWLHNIDDDSSDTPRTIGTILINSPNVLYFVKLYQLIDFYLLCITNKSFVLSNAIFSVNFKPNFIKSKSSEKEKALNRQQPKNTIRKLCIFNLKLHIIYVNNAKKFFVNKTQFNYTKKLLAKVPKQMKATTGNTKTRKIVHVCAFWNKLLFLQMTVVLYYFLHWMQLIAWYCRETRQIHLTSMCNYEIVAVEFFSQVSLIHSA